MERQAAAFRRSGTATQRTRALRAVGQLQAPRDLAAAKRLAADEKAPESLRVAAIAQLGPLLARSPVTLRLLMDLLADPAEPAGVRGAALKVLKSAAFHVRAFRTYRPRYLA